MGSSFPPTPPLSTSSHRPTPAPFTSTTSTFSVVPSVQVTDSSSTFLPTSSTTGPSPVPTFGPPTSGPSTSGLSTIPGVLVTSTVAKGIFGVGANFDPLIVFALVVAALVFLLLLGALIYCCCYYCGITTRPQRTIITRSPSLYSMRQEFVGPDVIVTRRPSVNTIPRKNYMYSAGGIGVGNDVTCNTIRPTLISRTPAITTLGDGYAMGHCLRSVGNRYGSGSVIRYQDDPSPKIITLY